MTQASELKAFLIDNELLTGIPREKVTAQQTLRSQTTPVLTNGSLCSSEFAVQKSDWKNDGYATGGARERPSEMTVGRRGDLRRVA